MHLPVFRKAPLACLTALLLVLFTSSGCPADPTGDSAAFVENVRVFPGDAPEFAQEGFDDSHWPRIGTGKKAATDRSLAIKAPVCWIRAHLSSSALPFPKTGIWIDPPGSAFELFFNGRKIGAMGRIGRHFVEAPRAPCLFLLPSGMLRADNILALRVMETAGMTISLNQIPFAIGDHSAMAPAYLAVKYRTQTVQWIFLTLLAIFTLISVVLAAGDIGQREYVAFAVLVFLYLCVYLLESKLFYASGLKIPAVQRILFFLCVAMAQMMLVFVVFAGNAVFSRWIQAVLALTAAFALALLWPWPLPVYRATAIHGTWVLYAVMALSCLKLAFQAVRRRQPESIPVFVGVMGFASGMGRSLFDPGLVVMGQSFLYTDLGGAFFLICVAAALMARHNRTQREVRLLSRNILMAHETERKRLSRDIHDGLGQSLMALKLQLQMMGETGRGKSDADALPLSGLVTEVSSVIAELRRLTLDLRPGFIDDTRLLPLLRYHAEGFGEKTGIKIQVTGPSGIETEARVKDNLYRICQEALHNVEKHSRADEVKIDLSMHGTWAKLVIQDNGTGFYPAKQIHKTSGIGLSSMRERAHLLGGRLSIRNRPSGGCEIIIEVPLK